MAKETTTLGSDLFIVDNRDNDGKVKNYLSEWAMRYLKELRKFFYLQLFIFRSIIVPNTILVDKSLISLWD